VQQEIARYFKSKIAKEEDSGDKSILLASDRQLLIHRERGEPNVNAVDIVDNKQN
jgi:hypothetical protein